MPRKTGGVEWEINPESGASMRPRPDAAENSRNQRGVPEPTGLQ